MISEEQKLIRIYFQGNSSFYDGRKEEDCPFYGGKEMTAWMLGWHDGQDDNLMDANEILEKIYEKRKKAVR